MAKSDETKRDRKDDENGQKTNSMVQRTNSEKKSRKHEKEGAYVFVEEAKVAYVGREKKKKPNVIRLSKSPEEEEKNPL